MYRISQELEGYLNLITNSQEATHALANRIQEVFPQVNAHSDTRQLPASVSRPGAALISTLLMPSTEEIPHPIPGFKAKLWRFWWVVWSHIEPAYGVLWERGWSTTPKRTTAERQLWIKVERFGWIDHSFWALQLKHNPPRDILIGYDPDKDEVYI